MKTKGQKGFAVVNIIVGVVLVMAGFFMFGQPDTGPGGFIALALGIAVLLTGAYTLKALRNEYQDAERIKKAIVWNTIGFVLSCIILFGSLLLPFIAPML